MKLYSYYRSSSAYRVRIVLELKGLAYEYVPVNLSPGVSEQASAGFGDVNPLRQVPTLEWAIGGAVQRLTQSVAIAEYLDELHPDPPLLPENPLMRARVREIVEAIAAGIQPLQNSATLKAVAELGSDETARAWARNAMTRGFVALEAFARRFGGRYAAGDAITLADVFLVPQMYNARRFEVDLAPFPKLVEVDARGSAHPAFERAHPDRQMDSPTQSFVRSR